MTMDRAYTNLLSHFQHPSSRITLQTVFSAIPHYLSHLPLPHPTQFTAFIISSSLWNRPPAESLWSLTNAFRSAVHFKNANLEKEVTGWFSRSSETLLEEWFRGVMKGVSRGNPQLRVAILGGLLLGLEDLKSDEYRSHIRIKVEGQVVVACAEVLETLWHADTWKDEFASRESDQREDMNGTIFLYVACQILPLVDSGRFDVLDLLPLIRVSQRAIKNSFSDGNFLNGLSLACMHDAGEKVRLAPECSLSTSLRNVSKNPLYQTAGPLAKLLSRALSRLAEREPADAWHAFYGTSEVFGTMCYRVESDWKSSKLASVTTEQDIEPHSREISTEVWTILKTMLFSLILVSQSILSAIPYIHPLDSSEPRPSTVARSILRSLYRFSFTLSRFGGVMSSGEGFAELKRVFYMALDITAADSDPEASNSFVVELLSTHEEQKTSNNTFWLEKTAYVLAVIEQLVPVLNESILENYVVPFCEPYLNDSQNRDTYESAHSMMLSIFAIHAKRGEEKFASQKPTLAEKLVPFYVDLLIKNSGYGRLSRAQLKLAYSSLVRSAACTGDDAFAWLCVETLLSRIEASASDLTSSMDLYVALVSLISCIPLSLLPRELEEVEKALGALKYRDRKELAAAVLEEITNRVGDREREAALSWWCVVAPKISVEEQADY